MRKGAISLVLAGALTALAGATAQAASASTTTPAPLSMSLSPATVAVQPGLRHYAETVKVSNTGTKTIKVSTSVRLFGHAAGACTPGSSPSWAKIEPVSLMVKPGHAGHARFTATVPAGIGGTQDVAGLFTATTVGASGTASLGGTIAARMVMRAPGSTTIPRCGSVPQAAAHHGSGTIPFAPIGGALLAILAAVAVVGIWRRRRSSRA